MKSCRQLVYEYWHGTEPQRLSLKTLKNLHPSDELRRATVARSRAVAWGRAPERQAVTCGHSHAPQIAGMSQLFTYQFLPDLCLKWGWTGSPGTSSNKLVKAGWPKVQTDEQKKKRKGGRKRRLEELMEVGSWQHWCLQLFPPQTINEERGRACQTLQCLEETDSIYIFLYETQRTNSKNNPQR